MGNLCSTDEDRLLDQTPPHSNRVRTHGNLDEHVGPSHHVAIKTNNDAKIQQCHDLVEQTGY